MSRRPVELVRRGGQEIEDRLVCSYSPASGIMTLVTPFDPPAEPGDTLQVDLAASLNIDASRAGEDYRVIWASDVDVPGGGDVKIRITPYDRIRGSADGSQGCAGDAAGDDNGRVPGNQGTPGILYFSVPASIGFTPEPAWLAPLAEIDDPVAVAAGDIDGDGIYEDIDGDGIINFEDDDIDGDSISNELDDDIDGDDWSNADENLCGTEPRDDTSIPADGAVSYTHLTLPTILLV